MTRITSTLVLVVGAPFLILFSCLAIAVSMSIALGSALVHVWRQP